MRVVVSHGLASSVDVKNDDEEGKQEEEQKLTNLKDNSNNNNGTLKQQLAAPDDQTRLIIARDGCLDAAAAANDDATTALAAIGNGRQAGEPNHDDDGDGDGDENSKLATTMVKTVTISEPRTSPNRQRRSKKRRPTSGSGSGFFRTLFSCGGSCGGGAGPAGTTGAGQHHPQHHHSANTTRPKNSNHHSTPPARASDLLPAAEQQQTQESAAAATARSGAPVSHLHNFLDELGSYMEKANRKVKMIHNIKDNIMSHHLQVKFGGVGHHHQHHHHQRSASNHETELLASSSSKQQPKSSASRAAVCIDDSSKPTISDYNRKLSNTSTEDLLSKKNAAVASKVAAAATTMTTTTSVPVNTGITASARDQLNNTETDVDEEEENDEDNEEYEEDEEAEDEDDEEEEEHDDEEEEEEGGITDGEEFVEDEEEDEENLSNEEAECNTEYTNSGRGRRGSSSVAQPQRQPPNLILPADGGAETGAGVGMGSSASSQKHSATTNNKSGGGSGEQLPSFSFEEFSKDQQQKLSSSPALRLDHDPYDDDDEEQQQPAKQQQKSTNDYFSKFLTPNNILTDRGCIVNLRTGSFNLGCQQSSSASCSNEDNLNMSMSMSGSTSTADQDHHHHHHNHSSSSAAGTKPTAPLSLLSSLSQQPILGGGAGTGTGGQMTSSLSFHVGGRSSSPLSDRLVNSDFSPNRMDDSTSNGSSNLVLIPYILIRSRQKINATDAEYETDATEYTKTTPSTLPASGEAIAKSVSSQISRIVAATNNTPSSQTAAMPNDGGRGGSAKSSFLSVGAGAGGNNLNVGGGGGGGSFLGAPDQQDQRRCSHDPNIEKLHKNYINNVKLNAVAPTSSHVSVSTTTTTDSSAASCNNMQAQSCGSAQTVSSVGSGGAVHQAQVPTIRKSGSKKVKKDPNATGAGDGLTRKESRKSQRAGGAANDDKSGNAAGGGGVDSEESDVVNDITKVSKWLKDNKNHHKSSAAASKTEGKDAAGTAGTGKKTTTTTAIKSAESSIKQLAHAHASHNMSVSSSNQEEEEDDDGDNDETSGRTTTDSAIEADQYGSVSTLSKTSSGKSRVNWPSFTKYYHAHFFQSIDTTWSKYQISAMSLEQIMALRKLALIDFSKLLEQQHSLLKQIFSKRRGIDEFKRVYESIDSINNGSTSVSGSGGRQSDAQQQLLRRNKANKSHSSSNKDTDNLNNPSLSGLSGASSHLTNASAAQQRDSIIIDKRKVSHQLGAQIGAHPNTNVVLQNRKKRNKHSLKKQEQQLLFEKNQMQLRHRLGNAANPASNQIAADLPSMSGILADPLTATAATDLPLSELNPDLNPSADPSAVTVPDASKPKQATPVSRVFGLPLSTIMQQTGQPLPQRILEAMRYLRKIGSNEVGIFRKNGVKTRINRLKELIDSNEPGIHFQSNEYNVYDIADTVKLYFRELPECLITNKLSDILLSNYSSIQLEQRRSVLQQLMLLIPDENRLVLQTLLLFLSEIAKHDKKNQMTLNNLAVCFSPVIFHLNVDAKLKLKPKRFSTKLKSSSKTQKEPSPTLTIETSPSIQAKLSIVATAINQSKSNPHLANEKSAAESPGAASDSPNNTANNIAGSSAGLVGSSSFSFNDGGCQRSSNNSLQDSQLSSTIVNNESASNTNEQNTSKSSLNSQQLLMTSNTNLQQQPPQMKTLNPANALQVMSSSSMTTTTTTTMSKTANYKRKASDTINKAASSLVHFSTGLTELTSSSTSNAAMFFSTSSSSSSKATDNFQIMSKVVQQCVADMIQYSMDLFTVPVENFEKLRLSATLSSEPRDVEYFYEQAARKLKRSEYFKSNVNIDNMFWSFLGKHEDVSIYYFKNDQVQQLKKIQQQQTSQPATSNTTATDSSSKQQQQLTSSPASASATAQAPASNAVPGLQHSSSSISSITNNLVMTTSSTMAALPTSLFIPQQFENFNDRLKLWKCCTLVKCANLTAEKIMNRIKNERYLWDDDFKEGKCVEQLDTDTDLYRYVISFMPPHPSRDFFEIRHWSKLEQAENPTIILTSSSVNHQSKSKLVGDIRANLLISKYVIEKLAGNDTITTFKITHYVKLDYKGFSLEFYNRTFGYMMARLLYNLKQSLTSCT